MSDLTRGPIGRHLAGMAAFIGAGLVFQAAYFVVDLFFVSRLGPQVVAGVASAGNFSFWGWRQRDFGRATNLMASASVC